MFTSTYLTDDLTSSDGPEITGSFDIVLYKNCIGEISRVLVNFLSQKPMMFVQNRCDVNSRAAPVCQRHCHCHCQSQTNSHCQISYLDVNSGIHYTFILGFYNDPPTTRGPFISSVIPRIYFSLYGLQLKKKIL